MKFSQHNNARRISKQPQPCSKHGPAMAGAGGISAWPTGISNSVNAAETNPKQTVQLNTATTAELAQG